MTNLVKRASRVEAAQAPPPVQEVSLASQDSLEAEALPSHSLQVVLEVAEAMRQVTPKRSSSKYSHYMLILKLVF